MTKKKFVPVDAERVAVVAARPKLVPPAEEQKLCKLTDQRCRCGSGKTCSNHK